MWFKKSYVNFSECVVVAISLLFGLIFGLITLISLSLNSLPEFLFDFTIVSVQNGTILSLLLLICISVYCWMCWLNYEEQLRWHGMASVLYIFLIFFLFFIGALMISMAASSPISNTTSSVDLQKQAMNTIGSGLFGNGIGIIGIAAAIFGFLLNSTDKIAASTTLKTIVYSNKIKNLAMGWMIIALIIFIIFIINVKFFQFLPAFYPITLLIIGLLIEVFGFLLFIFGYLKYKERLPN